MAKCELNLSQIRSEVDNGILDIDPEETLSTSEFVTRSKEYLIKKLEDLQRYNLSGNNSIQIAEEISSITEAYGLNSAAPDFFNVNNIKNMLLEYNKGIIANNRQDSSTKILEPVTSNLDQRFINNEFINSAYGSAVDVRLQAEKDFANYIVNAVLLDRTNGTVTTSTRELNNNIQRLNQTLLSNIVSYLKVYTEVDNELLDNAVMYINDDYTGIVEQLRGLMERYLSTTPEGLQDLRAKSLNGNRRAKAQLTAYNSYVLLRNIDPYINLVFRKNIIINHFGDYSGGIKYQYATKGADNKTTWSNDDNPNPEKLISGIVKLLVGTTKFYRWNNRSYPVDNKYLNFQDFNFIVAKVKSIGQDYRAYNIFFNTLDIQGIQMQQIINGLSEETQNIIRKHSNFASVINSYRNNPQVYFTAIYELLTNQDFYNLVSQSPDTNIYSEFQNYDKDLLFTVYKGILSNIDSESIRFINNSNLSRNYYAQVIQTMDSIFDVKYIQYKKDDNGSYRARTLIDQSYDDISRRIEQIINLHNSKALGTYQSLVSKYHIEPIITNNSTLEGIQFNIPGINLSIISKLDGTILFRKGIQDYTRIGESYFNNQKIREFLDDILHLNLGISSNTEYTNALIEEYNNSIEGLTTDLVRFASRVLLNMRVSNEELANIKTKSELINKIKELYKTTYLPTINSKLGEMSLTSDADINILKRLTNAKASLQGLTTSTSVQDSEGNTQSTISLSRLLGSVTMQWETQVRQSQAAASNCLLIKNPKIFKGLYTAKEAAGQDTKAHTEFTLNEFAYSTLVLDFMNGLLDTKLNNRHIYGQGVVAFIPSVNSDKNTIGRMLVDLNQTVELEGNNIRLKDLTPYQLQQVISSEFGTIYTNIYKAVEQDWHTLLRFMGLSTDLFDINFTKLNNYFESKGLNPVEQIQEALLNYNSVLTNYPLSFIDQVHYINNNGKLSFNRTLVSLINRFNPNYFKEKGINLDPNVYPDNISFWNHQKWNILKDLIDSKFGIDLTNSNQAELIAFINDYSDWVSDSGTMILAKIRLSNPEIGGYIDEPITSKERLEQLASEFGFQNYTDFIKQNVDSITLNPIIEKYNYLDYLFTEEYLITTVGSHIAHPGKGNTVFEEEAARKKAQNKRNVSQTASMQEFLLKLVDGIPEYYNVAVIEDVKDTLYNVSGVVDERVKPYDGATFVNPFLVYLENISLGAAKAGLTKKQFVHFYNERTGTGGIIKTAGFAITNDLLRNSKQLQIMMQNMTDRVWTTKSGTETVVNILERFGGPSDLIDYTDLDNPNEGIYFKQNGRYYRIVNIINTGPNTYKRILQEVTQDGAEIGPIIDTGEEILVNTNFKLWQLFGGKDSMELNGTKLIPSENSIKQVVKAINNIGVKINQSIKTQDDVYQPLKHSDIHYLATIGAVKQGAANINSKAAYSNIMPLNYMRVKCNQIGIQLDKEHHADDAEISLMTQVLNACSLRGYTIEKAIQLYNAMNTLTAIGTQNITKAISQFIKNPDQYKEELRTTVNKILLKALSTQNTTNNLASVLAQDIIQQLRNKKSINWNDVKLPISDNTIYAKLASTIAVELTNSGIKQKIDGILAVLTPSYGIIKLYGDRKLESFNSSEELAELQSQQVPVYDISDDTTSPSNIDIGRAYKITRVEEAADGTITSNTTSESITTPLDYYNILEEIQAGKIVSMVEDVEAGRELGSYNTRFTANGRRFQLYDLDSVRNLFYLEDYIKKQEYSKIADLALQALPPQALLIQIIMTHPDLTAQVQAINQNLIQDPNFDYQDAIKALLNSYNISLTEVFNAKYVEKTLRSRLQRDLNALSPSFSNNTVIINNTSYTVDKSTLEVIPYEIVMPKTFINEFGLDQYDNLFDIKQDPNFFLKRAIRRYASKITNDNNYDIELKNLNGNHYYILDASRESDIEGLRLATVRFEQGEDGSIVRKDYQDGNIMYSVSSLEDKIYVDEQGNEVIVTNNLEFYVENLNYSILTFSQKENLPIHTLYEKIKDVKNKAAKFSLYYLKPNTAEFRYLNNTLRATNFVDLDNLTDEQIQNEVANSYPLQLMYSRSQEMYNSFLKSLEVVVARIPSQSMQSFMAMKVIAYDNPNINNAFVSTAQIWLQGSDYDIDSASIATYSIDRSGRLPLWSPYSNLTTIEKTNESFTLPFPTGQELEFQRYTAQSRNDKYYRALSQYIGPDRLINIYSIDEETGKDTVDIQVNSNIDIQMFKDLLSDLEQGNIKIPSQNTKIHVANKFGITVEQLDILYDKLKSIVDAHNLYFNNLDLNKVAQISQNYAIYQMYSISNDPTNLIQSQTSVDGTTGPIKEIGNSSQENIEALNEVPGNFLIKFQDIIRNQKGKKGIGICATSLKTFEGLTQFYNYILNYGNNEQQKRLLFNVRVNNKPYRMLANAFLKHTNNVNLEEVLNAVKNIDQSVDSAIIISALLSLATDNAKELQLSKLNATDKTLGIYTYGVSIGMDIKEIADILMSDLAQEISSIMEGNQFLNDSGAQSLNGVFNYFELGPSHVIRKFKLPIKNELTQRFSNPYDEFINLLQRYPGYIKQNQFGEAIKEFATSEQGGFRTLNDKLQVLNNIKNNISNFAFSEEMLYKLRQLIDFIETYCRQWDLVQNNIQKYRDLKTLAGGASEMRMLGTIYKNNQGLPTKAIELIERVRNIENIIQDRMSQINQEERRAGERVSFSDGIIKNSKFNLIDFITNPEIRELIIKQYENIKHTFNILDATQVPHFFGYLKVLAEDYIAMYNQSAKFRAIVNIGNQAINEIEVKTTNERLSVYKGVSNYVDDYLINSWLLDSNIVIQLKAGEQYYDNTGVLQTSESIIPIQLGTPNGNATFKRWMELYVIPKLKQGKILPNNTTAPGVKGNEVIKNLFPQLYDRNVSRNTSINYTIPINMLPRTDADRVIFNMYKQQFNNLAKYSFSDIPGVEYPIIDLLYYYNLIAYSGKLGESSLTALFEDMQNTNSTIKAYHQYIADFDQSKEITTPDDDTLIAYCASLGSPYTTMAKYIYSRNPENFKVQLMYKVNPAEIKVIAEQEGQEVVEEFIRSLRNNYNSVSDQNIDYNYFTRGKTITASGKMNATIELDGQQNSVTVYYTGTKLTQVILSDGTTLTFDNVPMPYIRSLDGTTKINIELLKAYIENKKSPC